MHFRQFNKASTVFLKLKKCKIASHSCPKTDSMNYNSPPLNESELNVAMKADSDNSGLDTSEDPKIMFASTMRALLSDYAATVTQARLYNLHKGLDLHGKPTQLLGSETKRMMKQETLDALISNKPP
ncbi:hypothetical protein AYI69_g8946 [Smittium culicis]|uniref:Uncharacterized protein n=1 Tax=Smittium culicis TaxID=133412 RepID=A0A1R1XG44_9FUNG|nr:hypothetical protein AYI69_g8946 [Smittium culicis]